MDTLALAAQYFDASSRITLLLSLVVSGAAFLIMHFYTRAIMRESQRSGSAEPNLTTSDVARPSPSIAAAPLELLREALTSDCDVEPRSPAFVHAGQAFRRAAYCYVIAGVVHAALSTALLFGFRFYAPPANWSQLTLLACYAGVFWGWFFATVVALALFRGPDRRFRTLLVTGYVLMLPAMGVLLWLAGAPRVPFADVPMIDAELRGLMSAFAQRITGEEVKPALVSFSPLTQPTLFFSLTAAPFVIPLLAFNRFVRGTVGPLFITLALLLTLGSLFLLEMIVLALKHGDMKQIFGDATYRVIMGTSVAGAALIASGVILWVTRRYRRTQLSDQTFLFDALWLSVSLCVSVYLMGLGPRFAYLLGLAPFALYKLVLWYGFGRFVMPAHPLPNARLLFLRVFGSARRSEKLLDLLLARWRYAGSVYLISGTDLARSRFEPDEFLDFISGRFTKRYINSSSDVEARLAETSPAADPDGRYRVHEYFCRADVWQETVKRLMERSDLAVMDLRGFTPQRRGCVFELGALIDNLSLDRVVLLIDRTTDMSLLKQTLETLWENMAPSSPNRSTGRPSVTMLDLQGGYRRAVNRLLIIGDRVMSAGTAPPSTFWSRSLQASRPTS